MKMRFALLAVCAGTFVIVHAPMALAIDDPIPGVDIVVKKHPGGNAITVGNCQSGGGKVVKIGGQWACTGLPASGKAGKALPKTGKQSISDQASSGNLTSSRSKGTKGNIPASASGGVGIGTTKR